MRTFSYVGSIAASEENRYLKVTYANGDKQDLYFKDFNSAAMIESIVARAKRMAIKESSTPKSIRVAHLLAECVDEFSQRLPLRAPARVPRRAGTAPDLGR